ncbi:MAG: hypothetical protein ACRDTZ_00055 [Pseudonocardiaceae bacterium]
MWGRKRSRRDDEEWAQLLPTGAHEAGHAIAFRASGARVTGMSVGGWGGVTRTTGEPAPDNARGMEGFAVAVLAGQEAEISYLQRHHGYSRGRALRETAHGASSDMREFRGYSSASGLSEAEARRRARALVRHHRGRIDRLAERVSERGELGGWSI